MISILLYIIGRYLSIITKSSTCDTISCFKMTMEEMNIISQPGHQGWPGLAGCIRWVDQARSKISKFSLAWQPAALV
jgi:hypothetical protein